jgi:hypothetical protein
MIAGFGGLRLWGFEIFPATFTCLFNFIFLTLDKKSKFI